MTHENRPGQNVPFINDTRLTCGMSSDDMIYACMLGVCVHCRTGATSSESILSCTLFTYVIVNADSMLTLSRDHASPDDWLTTMTLVFWHSAVVVDF